MPFLFHNATLFGFRITHILNTGCAKIKKKKSFAKRLNMLGTEAHCHSRSTEEKEQMRVFTLRIYRAYIQGLST